MEECHKQSVDTDTVICRQVEMPRLDDSPTNGETTCLLQLLVFQVPTKFDELPTIVLHIRYTSSLHDKSGIFLLSTELHSK